MNEVELEHTKIDNSVSKFATNNVSTVFIFIKLIPINVYFVTCFFSSNRGVAAMIFILSQIFEFWYIKNISGIQLIGLTWFIKDETQFTDLFEFYFRPPPFVPTHFNSNIFWIGNFFSLVIWILILLFNFLQMDYFKIFLNFLSVFLSSLNLVLFIRAHDHSRKSIEGETLSSLLDGSGDVYLQDDASVKENI